MRVLYFGTYERGYPRNAQVISCLRREGVEVLERHEGVWDSTRDKWALGGRTALRLLGAEARLAAGGRVRGVDAVVVGYPGQLDMPLARVLSRRLPLIFNPLVSLTETLVNDRGRFRRGSPAGAALRALDRLALRCADVVVADTAQNAAFLSELGGVPHARLEVCLVGAEERVFRPVWKRPKRFHALFVGKLIPLHGLETILAAAELAPEVSLRIVGSGQLERLLGDRPANVEWVPWIPYERLAVELRSAAAALGIFGSSPKAARVIPNKVFQALACGTPVITADTPASRELLVDGRDALLVPPGNPEALADALRRLTADTALARRIGAAGLATYHERSSEEVLGQRWRALIEALL